MAELDIARTLALASEHQRAGRLAAAEALYTEVVLAEPTLADAWHMLGLVSGLQGRAEMGLYFILQAINLDDTRATFYSNLGECYRAGKTWDEAIAAYRRAIRLDPGHYPSRHNLSIALMEINRFQEAEEMCRSALQLRPQMAESWNILGNVYYGRQDLVKAEEYYRKALSCNPQYPAAQQNLQKVLERQTTVPIR